MVKNVFFEVGVHVCDEAALRAAASGFVKSRSVFGKTRIEITACRYENGETSVTLEAIDAEAEALVLKERRENPLRYDHETEWRQRRARARRHKEREQAEKNASK